MEYTFSLSSFFFGILIIAAGAAALYWYRPIADNMMSGMASYDRLKLYALIAVVIGFLVMTNLHMLLLGWLVGLIFNRG